jgi:hypothetical protein
MPTLIEFSPAAMCSMSLCLLALMMPSAIQAQEASADAPADNGPLAITIESPHGGIVDGPVIHFSATISDPEVLQATLVSNGASYDVPVRQGRVEQQLVAIPGNNRVGLVVEREGETARRSVTFRYEGEPMELIVLLTWPTEGEIIDLWVREPTGETCKWDHRATERGGRLLDFSSDAIGFGSQGYVLSTIMAGTFRFKIHYWGAYSQDDDRSIFIFHELIRRWDELTREMDDARTPEERARLAGERADVEARLDRWSTPAAQQTPVHAEVILFPGTSSERRWRFDRVAQRTGQLLTLGEIEVSDEMIRAARSEVP